MGDFSSTPSRRFQSLWRNSRMCGMKIHLSFRLDFNFLIMIWSDFLFWLIIWRKIEDHNYYFFGFLCFMIIILF